MTEFKIPVIPTASEARKLCSPKNPIAHIIRAINIRLNLAIEQLQSIVIIDWPSGFRQMYQKATPIIRQYYENYGYNLLILGSEDFDNEAYVVSWLKLI